MEDFELLYRRVQGIVHKARKEYYIKLWEKEDWDQEGMIVLYDLLQQHPELMVEEGRLYVYYKVKFRNYLKDVIRKQESQKRKFDRMAYEEVSELAHSIKSPGLLTDDFLALRQLLEEFREKLPLHQREQYTQLLSGSSFKGRRQMLRNLALYLADFKN